MDKIPPTYINIKGLLLSNGYNDNRMFKFINNKDNEDIYSLMGLKV